MDFSSAKIVIPTDTFQAFMAAQSGNYKNCRYSISPKASEWLGMHTRGCSEANIQRPVNNLLGFRLGHVLYGARSSHNHKHSDFGLYDAGAYINGGGQKSPTATKSLGTTLTIGSNNPTT